MNFNQHSSFQFPTSMSSDLNLFTTPSTSSTHLDHEEASLYEFELFESKFMTDFQTANPDASLYPFKSDFTQKPVAFDEEIELCSEFQYSPLNSLEIVNHTKIEKKLSISEKESLFTHFGNNDMSPEECPVSKGLF